MVSRPRKRIPRFPFDSTLYGLAFSLFCCYCCCCVFDKHTPVFVDAFPLSRQQQLSGISIAPSNHHSHLQPQQYRIQGLNGLTKARNNNHPVSHTSSKHRATIHLFAALPFYATETSERSQSQSNQITHPDAPAFVIDPITKVPGADSGSDELYKTIANLCINVFFQELLDPSGRGNVNLLKAWQINYLKNLQTADLERRRNRFADINEMFLAYEIRPVKNPKEFLSQPLLMDEELERAYNLNMDPLDGKDRFETSETNYVRGDLIGFVEVTQRSYGLGTSIDSPSLLASFNGPQLRPILTNLAVRKDCRQYGLGSKLLETCEQHVADTWKKDEIILEVEDYNDQGLEFYRKRGYEVLFSDPASRRYDIQGFWLNKVRCRRDIMRKALEQTGTGGKIFQSANNLFRTIRDSVGSTF